MQGSVEKGCVLAQTVLEYAEEAVELRGRSFLLGISMTAYPAYTQDLPSGPITHLKIENSVTTVPTEHLRK